MYLFHFARLLKISKSFYVGFYYQKFLIIYGFVFVMLLSNILLNYVIHVDLGYDPLIINQKIKPYFHGYFKSESDFLYNNNPDFNSTKIKVLFVVQKGKI